MDMDAEILALVDAAKRGAAANMLKAGKVSPVALVLCRRDPRTCIKFVKPQIVAIAIQTAQVRDGLSTVHGIADRAHAKAVALVTEAWMTFVGSPNQIETVIVILDTGSGILIAWTAVVSERDGERSIGDWQKWDGGIGPLSRLLGDCTSLLN